MDRIDPIEGIDALLARYVAGGLPAPARVLVEAHMDIRSDSLEIVKGMEALAGDALEAAAPIELRQGAGMLEAIFASSAPRTATRAPRTAGGIFPPALRDFVGFDAADTPWRTKMPGFREYEIEVDGCHFSIFWIKPGRTIPAHTHGGVELSLVLDGAFSDGRGRYGRGDISIADESIDHRPIAEKDRPCIGIAVTDAPLRLTGPLGQRLGDIIGM